MLIHLYVEYLLWMKGLTIQFHSSATSFDFSNQSFF